MSLTRRFKIGGSNLAEVGIAACVSRDVFIVVAFAYFKNGIALNVSSTTFGMNTRMRGNHTVPTSLFKFNENCYPSTLFCIGS